MPTNRLSFANTSGSAPLQVFQQTRKAWPAPTESAPAPYRARRTDEMTPAEHADLERFGSENVETRSPAPYGSGGPERVAVGPRWQIEGESSLPRWISCEFLRREKAAKDAADEAIAQHGRPLQRLCEDWSEPRAFDVVPPRSEVALVFSDNTRYMFNCEDPQAFIQFTAPPGPHWFVLRTQEKGRITSTIPVGPGKSASHTLGKVAVIVEQRPT